MKKVLFLHGLESRPGGTKPTFLTREGYEVFNPRLPKASFEESVKIAQSVVDTEDPDVIVGSSRGAAVATCLKHKDCGLVLIAPAWARFLPSQNADKTVPKSAMIIHSKNDTVVPFTDSERLSNATGAKLIQAGTCHRMSDCDALDALLDAVRWVTR